MQGALAPQGSLIYGGSTWCRLLVLLAGRTAQPELPPPLVRPQRRALARPLAQSLPAVLQHCFHWLAAALQPQLRPQVLAKQ